VSDSRFFPRGEGENRGKGLSPRTSVSLFLGDQERFVAGERGRVVDSSGGV